MKQGWEIKSLGEIADVEYGFTDKSTEEGDYRYVRITDIDDNGELISTEKKYLKHSKEAASFLLKDNDLLMARTGATFAKVLLYEDVEPSVFASYLIRINFKEKIDNKLYWYFSKTKSYWDQANSLASGAAQPHFNGAAVKQVIFSYPKSLPEQQRIVSILDEAFAAIAKAKANAEQNLKNAKELFESYLQGVFGGSTGSPTKRDGWEIKTLGEVSKINYGYTEKASFDEVGPKFLRITDIQENGVDWETVPYCKCSDKDLPKYKLETGDIVFARTGATTGKSYLINNPPNSVFASYLIRLRMNSINEFIPEFISYFFQTKTYWDKINAGISGSAQGGFNATKLGELEFHFPKSKEKQQTIVRQLDALRAETQKLEAVYQKKIADLEELKKSILQKAFAGELRSPEGAAYDSEAATPLAKKTPSSITSPERA